MTKITASNVIMLVNDGLLGHLNDDALTEAVTVINEDAGIDAAERERAVTAIEEERVTRSNMS